MIECNFGDFFLGGGRGGQFDQVYLSTLDLYVLPAPDINKIQFFEFHSMNRLSH